MTQNKIKTTLSGLIKENNMFLKILCFVFLSYFPVFSDFCLSQDEENVFLRHPTCHQILTNQPESIENMIGTRLYLKASNIYLTPKGFFLANDGSSIEIQGLFHDENGYYIDALYVCHCFGCGRCYFDWPFCERCQKPTSCRAAVI